MSSIIRATTTSGLQVAPDNSGSLQLQTNGTTTAVTIDTSQNVGIGTTSPNAYGSSFKVLQVSSTDSGIIQATGTNNSVTNEISTTTTIGQVGTRTNHVLALKTNDTERMRIDTSGYATGTVNGGGAGLLQSQHYYRLNSGLAGSNATGAQSIFGVGVSLLASTQYEFEMVFSLGKTVGTTSHTIALGFGGTATLNNIGYINAANAIPTGNTCLIYHITTAASTVFTSAITSATPSYNVTIKGTVSVNAAGTFIPQYTLSAAPGGAYTTAIGSYIKIAPLAASGANVSIGSWA